MYFFVEINVSNVSILFPTAERPEHTRGEHRRQRWHQGSLLRLPAVVPRPRGGEAPAWPAAFPQTTVLGVCRQCLVWEVPARDSQAQDPHRTPLSSKVGNISYKVFLDSKRKLVLCSKQIMRLAETDHVFCFSLSHGYCTFSLLCLLRSTSFYLLCRNTLYLSNHQEH